MSALGPKAEELRVSITTPLCGAKADIATRSADFAFGAITGLMRCSKRALIDHLVGAHK